MHRSPIADFHGRPVYVAGGRHAFKTQEHRGFVVSLEWVISDTRRRQPPCMVIWPAGNVFAPSSSENGMWLIGRRAISEFVEFTKDGKCTGGASEHCVREAREALPILGKDINDKAALLALVDCVVKFAPDLVLMPVTPRWLQAADATKPMWDVTAKNKGTGKVISEAEV